MNRKKYLLQLLECKKQKANYLLGEAMKAAKIGIDDEQLTLVGTLLKFNLYLDKPKYKKLATLSKVFLDCVLLLSYKNYGFISIPEYQNKLPIKVLHPFQELKTVLDKELKQYQLSFGKNHSSTIAVQTDLALIYQDVGEYKKAQTLLENALKATISIYGEKHKEVALRRFYLANILLGLGEYKKAHDCLLLSLASDEQNYDIDHPAVIKNNLFLAYTYSQLQDFEKAHTFWEKPRFIIGKSYQMKKYPHDALGFLILFYLADKKKDYHLSHRGLILTITACAENMDTYPKWSELKPILSDIASKLIETSLYEKDQS